jgi:hypothetical protein
MDSTHFDRIARLFARRHSRRAALAQAAAGTLAAAGLTQTARAQDATPATGETGEETEYLFVQSFRSGTIAPKAGEDGTYTLTLEQGLGQTIYFSDRPERVVGAAPTAKFLDGLGFSQENPPNAALVVEPAVGETDIAVVELFNPVYDETTHTATYDAKLLEDWQQTLAVSFAEEPIDLAALAPTFGAAHLFIDDCENWNNCYTIEYSGSHKAGPIPGGSTGTCWSFDNWTCLPSNSPCNGPSKDHFDNLCNDAYALCRGTGVHGCEAGP